MKRLLLSIAVILLTISAGYTQYVITVCDMGCDYTSIQSAINASMAGDTIKIESGTYVENVDASGSDVVLTVGQSPGCVEIMGDLTLDNTVNFLVDIWGTTSCTEFDSTHVSGTLNLNDANLEIELNGFVPTAGDEFVFFTAGTLVGEFSQGGTITVNGTNFNIDYSGNQVTLSTCDGFEADVSGLDIILSGCDVDLAAIPVGGTAPFSFNWDWGGGSSTDSTVSEDITFETTFNLTITDDNGCTATTTHTVEVFDDIEISNVCVCTDQEDNTTFIVTFINWPNCSGPFDVGINYPATMGSGNTTVAGIPLDSSGVTTVVFGPVGNAEPSGVISINNVVNQIFPPGTPFSGDPVAYTSESAVDITSCPDPVDVETEAGECFGLIPDLTENPNLMWTGECGVTFTVEQSEVPGSMFGSAPGDQIDLVLTVTNDDCQGSDTCTVVLTLVDNEGPELIDSMVTCSSLDEVDIDSCLVEAEGFDGTTLESQVAGLYTDNCGTVLIDLSTSTTIMGSVDCGWTIEYIFDISDGNGNVVNCTVSRSGGDDTPPIITLTGDALVELCQGTAYADAGATASDNCAGDISGDIVTVNPVNTNVPGTYTVTYNVSNACSLDAPEVTRTVEVFEEPEIGIEVNGVAVGFGSTFDFCYDDNIEVILANVVSGTAPFDLSWEVFIDGSMVADPTLSGDTTGVGVGFEFFSNPLDVGEYEIMLTSLVDSNGCEPSDIGVYTMTIAVHEEPEMSFEVNGSPVGFGSTFEFCYDENIQVEFAGMVSGIEPVDIAWEVFKDGNMTADPTLSGSETGVNSPFDLHNGTLSAGSYEIEVTSLVDGNGCEPSNLSAYTMTIIVDEEPEMSFEVNGTPVGFGSTFEFCYDENIQVEFTGMVSGIEPVDIAWEVYIDGSLTSDPTLSGSETGVNSPFDLFNGTLAAGSYEIEVTSLVDGNGCEPSNLSAYTMTIIVDEEPEMSFEVNGTPVGFGSTFEFCYDETIQVEFAGMVSGIEPVDIAWEVYIDGSLTSDPTLSGSETGVNSPFDLHNGTLAAGSYEIEVTSLVDGNGCEPSNLSAYTMTIIVDEEPEMSFEVNGTPVGFGSTFEYCYDENIQVEFTGMVSGIEPVDLSWEVFIDGSMTSDPTLSGSETGINSPFDLHNGTLAAGSYEIELASLVDGNGCEPSNLSAYTMTIIVDEEPEMSFEVNGSPVGFGSTFEFCYDESIQVEFAGMVSGSEPVDMAWEVFIDGNMTADQTLSGSETGVNSPFDLHNGTLAAGSYEIEVTSLVDGNGCEPSNLSAYTMTIIVDEEPEMSFEVNGTPVGFGSTFEFCYDETIQVEFAGMVSGSEPVDIAWEVFIDGNMTADPTLSGSETGVNSPFDLHNGTLASGSYEIEVTSLVDGNGCEPSNLSAYTMMIIVNEEPEMSFEINGTPVGFGSTFEFCYDETIQVEFTGMVSGIEPLDIAWEVYIDGSLTSDPTLSGSETGVNSPFDLHNGTLASGSYEIELTSLVDGNGCEPSNLFAYTMTIVVNPEPDVFFTINGEDLVPFDTFEFCCDEENIDIELVDEQGGEQAVGEEPFDLEFTVDGGTPIMLTGINFGHQENLVDHLPMDGFGIETGDYLIEITNFIDANGCALSPGTLAFYQFTISVNPDSVAISCPVPQTVASCQDQASIDSAFADWLATASFSGGCNGVLSDNNTGAPDSCGGNTTVTFTVESDCEDDLTCMATFTVMDPDSVEITCPNDITVVACEDVSSVESAFDDFLNEVSAMGGCEVSYTTDWDSIYPNSCGDTVIVEFTATDDACGDTDNCTATFTVEDTTPVVLSCANDTIVTDCQDQATIDMLFADWLVTASFTGGCNGMLSNDNTGAPNSCGANTTVTFTVASDCEDDETCTATFTVTEPDTVEITCPGDITVEACEDMDIATAFDAFLVEVSSTGGCDVSYTTDWDSMYPNSCGDTVIVEFTATDDACGDTDNCTATFTVAEAPPVDLICANDTTLVECQDQTAVDTAFANWLATASFVGGCDATLSDNNTGAPDACGGITEVTFTVESSCETDVECTRTFTVEESTSVVLNCATDTTVMECQDQATIDMLFEVWLATVSYTGGCNGSLSNDNAGAPNACGGNTTVTFTVESDCDTDVTCTSTFTVMEPDTVIITCPEDVNVNACEDAATVESAFNDFLAEVSAVGDCDVSTSNNWDSIYPDECGDTVIVEFTATDDSCGGSDNCTATFTIMDAPQVDIECPSETLIISCQSQSQVDSLFSEWMSEFSFEDGCNATADFDGNPMAPDSCGGMTTVTYRVESDCEADVVCERTFTVENAPTLVATCPESTMVDCPLPDNFDEVDSAFVDWINSFMNTGGCGTITETDLNVYDSPETCPAEVEVTYVVTDDCGQSDSCTVMFIVKDTIPCHLICPDTIMVNPDPDLCGSIVEYDVEIGGYCPMNGMLEPEQTEGLASGDTFPIGITTNVWEMYIAMEDTTVTCEFDVIVNLPVPVDDQIGCNSGVNVSINEECRAVVTPDEMLSGDIPCVNDFHEVDIEGRGTDTVDINDIGETLLVKVTRLDIYGEPTGNYCWGEILVEDKIPPTIQCVNDTISCLDDRDYILPTASDNCGEVEEIRLLNEEFDTEYCDSNYIRRIIRTYDALDSSGNVSEPCTQEIYIERVDFDEVVFPEDKTVDNENPLLCDEGFELASNGNPSPSSTGYPRIGNVYIVDSINQYCGFSANFSDAFLASTPCKTKIMRTWTIREWRCDTAQIVHTETQIIEIVDNEGPEMTCPQNMTVTTSAAHTCSANVYINRPMAVDSCNDVQSISLQYPGGFSEDWESGILNLPAGTNELNFTAYDICFNSSTCTTTITVVDETPPVAICKENTVVALTVDGTARVNAGVFNNGSFDQCGPVSFEVKRMDMGCDGEVPEFGPYLDFFCCDLEDNPIRVILQVTDEEGNTNECMVQVVVQDKLSSIINCPPNIEVSCEFDFDESDLSVFGSVVALQNLSDLQDPSLDPRNPIIINDVGNPASQPQNFGLDGYAYNNCDVFITEEVESEYDECGRGEIRRTFYATGLDDNISSQCLQTIKIENMTPFDFELITWPKDTMIENMCPGVDLDPQVLGTPQYEQGSCDKVHYTYTDQIFYTNDANDPVCFKVVRTWTVVDWCQFENGHYATFSQQQAIKVINNVAPTFTGNCEEITVSSFDTECEDGYVELIQSAEDDCTAEDQLVWEYDIDLHSNGIFDLSSNYNPRADVLDPTDASGTYPLGNHRIIWTVRDDCGNQSTCQQLFSVVNMTQPKAICKNGISVELMGMDTTGNGEFDTGVFELNASFLNIASHHTCGYGVSFAFSSNPDDNTMFFDCEDLGTHFIPLFVLAENQTQDVCIARVEIQDNMQACGASGGTSGGGDEGIISGQIKMENGKTVQYVEVDLEGSALDAVITDEEGKYAFPAMPLGGSYEVVPEKDINPLAGVTTFDVALIQRHILGVQLFNSPYQWIAADIDNNGLVDVRDISQLRRLILGTYNHFPKNTSWRFVEADFNFSGFNPLDENFDESYLIPDFSGNMPTVDFVGVKIGDINSSVNPSGLMHGSDERSSVNPVVFQIEDLNLSEGEIVEIPVKALNFEDIDAVQFTLLYDNNLMELVDVKGEAIAMDITNLGMHYLDQGMVTFSWNDLLPASVSEDEVLFKLVFEANKTASLHGNIDITSNITEARAYVRGVANHIQLDFESHVNAEGNYELFQNRPNPFSDQTLIGFKLAKNAQATITVFDVTGKVVYTVSDEFNKGYNEVILDNVSDWTNQVYYYRLDTDGFSASKKMIIIR